MRKLHYVGLVTGIFALLAAAQPTHATSPFPSPEEVDRLTGTLQATKEAHAKVPSMWIEAMTWPEIATAIQSGYRTVIVPTAGIEQNGPHLPLYKHRRVVRATSEKIAFLLGETLIAPVIDFVPEGSIDPKGGHMAYPGTISMPPRVFSDILENTALSLLAHGFKNIIFIGDSGDSQEWQARVAKKLQGNNLNVYHIDRYYANAAQENMLRSYGFSDDEIGGHSGLRDSAEFSAVAGHEVRKNRLENIPKERYIEMGSYGDITKADAALGTRLLQIKIENALGEICELNLGLPGCSQLLQ